MHACRSTLEDPTASQQSTPASITNAQVDSEFIALVNGSEAPGDHSAKEGLDAAGEKAGKGETKFLRFKTCSVWKPPKNTLDQSFQLIDDQGPDAVLPPEAANANLSPAPRNVAVSTTATITGCGAKPGT